MIIPDTRLFKSFQPNHMFAWISNEFYWPYNYFVSFFYLLTKVPNKDFFPYSFYTTVYTKINRCVVSFDINIANDITERGRTLRSAKFWLTFQQKSGRKIKLHISKWQTKWRHFQRQILNFRIVIFRSYYGETILCMEWSWDGLS